MQKLSLAIALPFLALYLQSTATVWIGYFALQEKIAAHCENKSTPTCSGKCQIKKIEEKTTSDTVVQIFIPDVSEFLPKKVSDASSIHAHALSFPTFSDSLFPYGHKGEVFRPPISI
jgi:hypothetical protein